MFCVKFCAGFKMCTNESPGRFLGKRILPHTKSRKLYMLPFHVPCWEHNIFFDYYMDYSPL